MITEKDRIDGAAIVALGLSQSLIKALVEQGAISESVAHSIITDAGHLASGSYSGDARKYAQHVLLELRGWLEEYESRFR